MTAKTLLSLVFLTWGTDNKNSQLGSSKERLKNISAVRISQQMVDIIIAPLSCSMFLLLSSHIPDGLALVL